MLCGIKASTDVANGEHGTSHRMAEPTRLLRTPKIAGVLRGLVPSVVLASFLIGGPCAAPAQDWMFRPSYFSYPPDPAVDAAAPPIPPRSAYRRAFVGAGPGFAVRGGYRYNYIFLRSGNSVDVTVLREGWFEAAAP